MPRRGRRRVSDNDVEVVSGAILVNFVTAVTASAQTLFLLRPDSFGTRLDTLADLHRYYCFTKIDMEFLDSLNNGDERPLVGFTLGNITAPTTAVEVSEMPHVAWAPKSCRVPVHLRLNRSHLRGMVPWFETEEGADVELDTQGTFVVTTEASGVATADQFTALIRYTCAFKERLPAQVSIDRIKALEVGADPGGDPKQTAGVASVQAHATPPMRLGGTRPARLAKKR
jgi:hypothetical protein